MAYFELDVCSLDETELDVFRTALAYARNNRENSVHSLPLADFYRMAGLGDEVYVENFKALMMEVMKVPVISQDYEPETLRGWSVFNSVKVTGAHIEFSVCPFAFEAREFS